MRRTVLTVLVLLAFAGVTVPAAANHGGSHQIISSGPARFTMSTSATFGLNTFPGPTFLTCKLDSRPAEACFAPSVSYAGLTAGSHHLVVSGHYDDFACDPSIPPCPFPIGVSDAWDWTIDRSKPTATLTAPVVPSLYQLGPVASVKWTGTDPGGAGIGAFTLARKRAPHNGTFGSPSFTNFASDMLGTSASLVAGAQDCFAIRAKDKVGNGGAFSPWRCVALPLDDRALSRSSGWTLSNSSVYFNSTATTTAKAGAVLAKTGTQLRRIGLVATKCATCGTATVRVDSTVIGTVSLFSSTTKYKQLITLPTFASRTGTVRVTANVSGKTVQIDGLALMHQ